MAVMEVGEESSPGITSSSQYQWACKGGEREGVGKYSFWRGFRGPGTVVRAFLLSFWNSMLSQALFFIFFFSKTAGELVHWYSYLAVSFLL